MWKYKYIYNRWYLGTGITITMIWNIDEPTLVTGIMLYEYCTSEGAPYMYVADVPGGVILTCGGSGERVYLSMHPRDNDPNIYVLDTRTPQVLACEVIGKYGTNPGFTIRGISHSR